MNKMIFLAILGFGLCFGFAQDELAFENLNGFVMLDWFQSFDQGDTVTYGNAGGTLRGPALSAGLNADIADMRFGLKLANIGLDRQDFEFKVTHRNVIGVLSFDNTPPPFGSDARKINLLALLSLQFEDIPKLSATFVSTTQAGESGYGINSLELELSDRYRELDPLVSEFRWRLGYGLETSDFVTEGLASELSHSVSTRLRAKLLSAEDGIAFSPELKAELSFSTEDAEMTSLKQKYDLKTAIAATEFETVNAALALTIETDKALKDSESFSVTSTRLEPFKVSAGLSRSAKGNEQTFSWNTGVDYPLSDSLGLGAAYSGSAGSFENHTLSMKVNYREQPWSAQASAELGLQANTSDSFSPRFRVNFSANYQTKDAWSGQFKGNFQYQLDRLSGSLDGSAKYDGEFFSLSGAGGLLYSDALSLRFSLDGFITVYEDISVHTNAAYRTNLATGGNTVTLGLGLRYTFGGSK